MMENKEKVIQKYDATHKRKEVFGLYDPSQKKGE
jgi:hypothetical protein